MKYEYKEIWEGDAGPRLIEQINELGEEGWRLIGVSVSDGGFPTAYLERENPSTN